MRRVERMRCILSETTPTFSAIPRLETERLVLRGHRAADFAESAAIWSDPGVVRYIGGNPSTAEEAWWRILGHLGHWSVMGFGYWALVERKSGRLAGEVGFGSFKRDSDPPFEGLPEAGWVLAPWAQGAGFATEALRAILSWGDANLAADRTICFIDSDHAASIAVARKGGYQAAGMVTYKGDACILFQRKRPNPL
ncbi:MAG: GNAT family N-acetyltransferase [Rhodospirillales bacterium]